jgi:dienelactone hydrolase
MKCTSVLVRHKRAALATAVAALFLAVGVSVAPVTGSLWVVAVPAPTGPNKIGTLTKWMTDESRTDPFRGGDTKRELMLRFWYPTLSDQKCRPAEYASPKIWAYLSRTAGLPLPRVKTNSCLGAPVAYGSHPIVLFSPGYTGMFTDCTFLFEELASYGYVVVSVAHTYETTAVQFPDGRLITSELGSYLVPDTLREDLDSLKFARSVRLADLKFVLNELPSLNTTARSPFAGRFDLLHVGVMGHSLGGEVAIASLEQEARFQAGVLIDGVVSDESTIGTGKPVMLLAAGRDRWSDGECSLWRNLRNSRLAVNFIGADHFTPTDAIWLLKDIPGMAIPVGSMGREKTISTVRNFITAFFDASLRNGAEAPLLHSPLPEYSGAILTMQSQDLCQLPTALLKKGSGDVRDLR